MRRLIGVVSVLGAMVATGFAFGQTFTPPPGVKMGITLYPITKYRGSPEVVVKDMPRLVRPIEAQSFVILHGVWDLCSDYNYTGRCEKVDASREALPVSLIVRSARLVGDQGPGYVAPVMAGNRPAGGAKGAEKAAALAQAAPPPRAAPAPAVAPQVAEGGVAGTNPSQRGVGVEFFAAPARAGLRILACSSGPLSGRCVQATADSFCAERGYVDSSNSGTENVGGKAYLVNVLCKSTPDSGPAAAQAAPAAQPKAKKKRGFLGL